MNVVQINRIYTQALQRLLSCCSNIFRFSLGTRGSNSEFGREEDLVSLSCTFEPTMQLVDALHILNRIWLLTICLRDPRCRHRSPKSPNSCNLLQVQHRAPAKRGFVVRRLEWWNGLVCSDLEPLFVAFNRSIEDRQPHEAQTNGSYIVVADLAGRKRWHC